MNSIHSTGSGKGEPAHYSADDDADFDFWRFRDLKERNIVSDRADLHRKQRRGFPKAEKLSHGQGAVALFRKRAVIAWLRVNLRSAEASAGN